MVNSLRHGHEISRPVELRSGGSLKFNVASFYPLLYRLEKQGLIQGRWVRKAGHRRRRYCRFTPGGKAILKQQRSIWRDVAAINRTMGPENA